MHWLRGAGITDSGAMALRRLRSLTKLNLDSRSISDSAVAVLVDLPALTHLDLFGARITDTGVPRCSTRRKHLDGGRDARARYARDARETLP